MIAEPLLGPFEWPRFLLLIVACAGVTALLIPCARYVRLLDDPATAPERKLQARAIPRVGGLLLVAGWTSSMLFGANLPRASLDLHWLGAGLASALVAGLIDDSWRGGLAAAPKLCLQFAAAFLFARSGLFGTSLLELVGGTLLGVGAMNAANTFDNADGALTLLATLGFALVEPLASAPLIGFLPFNLGWRRGAARAYLGDGASQLLGLALLLHPLSALLLLVPALDLARLAWVRWRAGSRPWIGDRRHLAHRFEARGWNPPAVVLALAATCAAPLLAEGSIALALGLGVLALGLALRASR